MNFKDITVFLQRNFGHKHVTMVTDLRYFEKPGPGLRTHQYVVGLDICVEHTASLEQLERQQQLLRVRAHRLHVQTDVLTILLQHLA